jgi:hypothetical protein
LQFRAIFNKLFNKIIPLYHYQASLQHGDSSVWINLRTVYKVAGNDANLNFRTEGRKRLRKRNKRLDFFSIQVAWQFE